MSNNQIVITSSDMESTYYCDWFVKADSTDKSLLFTFKNQNLEDIRSNQFVIRVYDLTRSTTSEMIDRTATGLVARQAIAYEPDEVVGSQPIYEYKLDGSIKYFQADTSYVRLQ